MKSTRNIRLLIVALALSVAGGFCISNFAGCAAPSSRVVQVQTLKVVGHTAEAAVAASAQLYASGKITAEQARQVMDIYDKQFQPAYRVAVNAVNANLDSIASPELVTIAAQLSALILTFKSN